MPDPGSPATELDAVGLREDVGAGEMVRHDPFWTTA